MIQRLAIGGVFFVASVTACLADVARAHELRPALLSIVESRPAEYDAELRVPLESWNGGFPTPVLPAGSERLGAAVRSRVGDHAVERVRWRVPGGLPGRNIGIESSSRSDGEVLVRLATLDGRTRTGRVVPKGGAPEARWLIPAAPTVSAVARTYLGLGVEHILTGLDHLAFVLGLILLAPAWRMLWKSVTAFTAAHSLTLVLSTFGFIRLPPAPVEATIALSILFIAREAWLAAHGRASSAARRPWPVAFTFGLLHGLGFAGALTEVGLPESEVALALLSFNIGVEIGQLTFVAIALLVGRGLGRLPWTHRMGARLAPTYVIGALAAFWCFERVSRFWG